MLFPSIEGFAVTRSYRLTILSDLQMICKLYIFWTCQETSAILADTCRYLQISHFKNFKVSYQMFLFQLCTSCLYILQVCSKNCTQKSYYQLFAIIISYFSWPVNGISLAGKIHIFWRCLDAFCQAIFTFDALQQCHL